MSTCTFFGHHDAPSSIKPALLLLLTDLITHHAVDTFFIGSHGAFDALAYSALRELSAAFPHIRYTVVLSRVPTPGHHPPYSASHTLLPDGVEKVPPRYAIIWRNRWMLRRSDVVITYVAHPFGSAAGFAAQAIRAGKTVYNLANRG